MMPDPTPQAPRRPPLAALPRCACGALIDEATETTCFPCRAGHRNRITPLYGPQGEPGPPWPLSPDDEDFRQAASRIETLERGVDFLRAALAQAQARRDYWRARTLRWQRLAALLAGARRHPPVEVCRFGRGGSLEA